MSRLLLLELILLILYPRFAWADWTWVSGSDSTNQLPNYGVQKVGSANNNPGARSGAISWTDSENNFWLFGGFIAGSGSNYGYLNDLWKYTPSNRTWTWISGSKTVNPYGTYGTKGVASNTNTPGGRQWATAWAGVDGSLYLFGGYGLASSATYNAGSHNDLWKFNIQTFEWTWLSGSERGWDDNGTYGNKGVGTSANRPGERSGAVGWVDANGDMWLFGGTGVWGYNDLWKYSKTTGFWSWMAGPNQVGSSYAVFGTKGQPATTNRPGERSGATAWVDNLGNLWLFGGRGSTDVNVGVYLNDLWKFNSTAGINGNWTWMGGLSTAQNYGDYGIQGTSSPTNVPGGRTGALSVKDERGRFWVFGGFGQGENNSGRLGDLWCFDPSRSPYGEWTWMHGTKSVTQYGIYGIIGQSSSSNLPGGREFSVGWQLSNSLWLYGGKGWSKNASGDLNDLWRFDVLNTGVSNWGEY